MTKYYAYYLVGQNKKGIVDSWAKCETIIKGANARYKSFTSEREAKKWLDEGAVYSKTGNGSSRKPASEINFMKSKLQKGIYFDAGTGRGLGAESRVTDENGVDLLPLVVDKKKLTEFNTYRLGKEKTHNQGELLGLYFALQVAEKKNIKKIFGDSKLIIDYWSLGRIHRNDMPIDTVNYSDLVTEMRKRFEENGGTVEYISGDINPADLGFHRQ